MVDIIAFKPTDIGLIPNDWEINTVNDLINLLTDYDANGSFASVAENVKVYDYEEFAWYVRSTDLENNSNMSNVRYVDQSSYNFLKKTSLYGGELLFLKRGDIGRVYLFKMKTKYATVAPNLYLLKINQKTTPEYLYYYFSTNLGQKQLKSKNASSTLGALYKDDVKSILVPLPPLPEQTAIATALSDMDALIAQTEKLIEKKKVIKQGVMQELLRPKEGWVTKKLGEVFEIEKGAQINRSTLDISGEFPVYNGGIAPSGYTSSFNTLENTIIISEGGNSCGYVNYIKSKFWRGGHCYEIRPNNYLNKHFAYFLLKHNEVEIMALRVGSGLPNIQRSSLAKFEIKFPDSNEQALISNILIDLQDSFDLLIAKLQKLKLQKQGMMQALLMGKIRLI